MNIGDTVVLREANGAIIPAGVYIVSRINSDGSFHVGGNTAVWPRRIVKEARPMRAGPAFAEYVKKASHAND